MNHIFAIKSITLKEKQEENIAEVKLEMNINGGEDLAFIFELIKLKQLPFVEISFFSPQKSLPLKEEKVATN